MKRMSQNLKKFSCLLHVSISLFIICFNTKKHFHVCSVSKDEKTLSQRVLLCVQSAFDKRVANPLHKFRIKKALHISFKNFSLSYVCIWQSLTRLHFLRSGRSNIGFVTLLCLQRQAFLGHKDECIHANHHLICTALATCCPEFRGLQKSNKNLILTITVHQLMLNLHYLPNVYCHYKLVLGFADIFAFLQTTLLLNKFAQPWFILCAKQHE